MPNQCEFYSNEQIAALFQSLSPTSLHDPAAAFKDNACQYSAIFDLQVQVVMWSKFE